MVGIGWPRFLHITIYIERMIKSILQPQCFGWSLNGCTIDFRWLVKMTEYEGHIYNPYFWSNSYSNIYSHRSFSVILQGHFRSSLFGHVNNPRFQDMWVWGSKSGTNFFSLKNVGAYNCTYSLAMAVRRSAANVLICQCLNANIFDIFDYTLPENVSALGLVS